MVNRRIMLFIDYMAGNVPASMRSLAKFVRWPKAAVDARHC
jgi:hypothetical protein